MNTNKYLMFIPLCILCILFFFLAACNSQRDSMQNLREVPESEIRYEHETEYLSFEEAIEQCTDVIRATYVRTHQYEAYSELEFQVDEVLKGATTAETIYVFEVPKLVSLESTDVRYVSSSYIYEPGQSYLLVLERNVSIYYEHDRYNLLGDIYIPLANVSNSLMYNESLFSHAEALSITSTQASNIDSYIGEVISASENVGIDYYGSSFTTSEQISDILAGSSCVYTVDVNNLMVEGELNNSETYLCTVTNVYKGELAPEEIEEGILIVFFKDSVSAGEEYLVMLNRVDENSRIYTLSSYNSIFSLDNATILSEIEEELGLYSEPDVEPSPDVELSPDVHTEKKEEP